MPPPGEMEKVSELISGLAPGPEEESPYEALFEATSCHSLDSLTSGKSSDRDSGRPDSEAGKVSSEFIQLFPSSTANSVRNGSFSPEFPLEGDSAPCHQPESLLMSASRLCTVRVLTSVDHLQKDRLMHSTHPGAGHEEEVRSRPREDGAENS